MHLGEKSKEYQLEESTIERGIAIDNFYLSFVGANLFRYTHFILPRHLHNTLSFMDVTATRYSNVRAIAGSWSEITVN
jgi:hypothetical protein